jgi:hypothetical protein
MTAKRASPPWIPAKSQPALKSLPCWRFDWQYHPPKNIDDVTDHLEGLHQAFLKTSFHD